MKPAKGKKVRDWEGGREERLELENARSVLSCPECDKPGLHVAYNFINLNCQQNSSFALTSDALTGGTKQCLISEHVFSKLV